LGDHEVLDRALSEHVAYWVGLKRQRLEHVVMMRSPGYLYCSGRPRTSSLTGKLRPKTGNWKSSSP
jgi:hypothetical protein